MSSKEKEDQTAHAYPLRSNESKRPVRRLRIRNVEERRVEEFVSGQWSRYNLLSVLFEARSDKTDVIRLDAWSPKAGEKPDFDTAKKQKYEPIEVGHKFGPSWSNHWVRATINVPKEWREKDGVQLQFDPSCEAMVFNEHGLPLQGITGGSDGRRVDFPLKPEMRNGVTLYLEVTCNALFGVEGGVDADPDPNRYFTLESAEVVVKRLDAWHLLWDFNFLQGCVRELPKDSVLQNKALWTIYQMQNAFRQDDLSTIAKCRTIAQEVLGKDWSKSAGKVFEKGNVFADDDQILWAVGHTHIDSAWLWPFSATQQKVARSWSTQLDLMDRYPEYIFTASTAQQFWWLENLYPKLFAKVQDYVKAGRFVPIGGTWVENDANLPSGEAFVRQFLYGQRYFKSRFGKRTNIFWLPDTFGYNSQIPQLARGSGTEYFFTQKLSWSNINRFPHNTFMWTGLDGTQIITHMTPVNNYDSMCGVDDIRRGLVNNQNLDVQPAALLLYGKGDGGGGPSEANIEALRRARAAYNAGNADIPKVASNVTPWQFYEKVRKSTDNGERLATWNGEIYLEFHRGVYTSHGSIKRWNRKLEILLHQLEWAATVASLNDKAGYEYPKEEIDHLWEPFLLCQFHDVLPGSSIRLVYEDAERIYADVDAKARKLLKAATSAMQTTTVTNTLPAALNTLGIPRRELVTVPKQTMQAFDLKTQEALRAHTVQTLSNDDALVLLEDARGKGLATVHRQPYSIMRSLQAVSVQERSPGSFTMSNNGVSFSVSGGRITSIQVLAADNSFVELIPHGRTAGLSICEDYPPVFDAWETEVYATDTDEELKFESATVVERGPWRAAMALTCTFGKSKVTVTTTLDALPASHVATASGNGSAAKQSRYLIRFDFHVDWQEKHKFLRFEIPTILRADSATYETQFGLTKRPTVRNTSWDAAKFEVCGHKFIDLSEAGLGLALLSDSKYGYSVEGGLMRVSLLRGAAYPDAHQDEGEHRFSIGMYPHLNQLEASDVVHVGRIFNEPLLFGEASVSADKVEAITLGTATGRSPTTQAVIIDTVKRGEDDFAYYGKSAVASNKTVIVRLYESLGSHAAVVVTSPFKFKTVTRTNLLEDDLESLQAFTDSDDDGKQVTKVGLTLSPFEVVTLKFTV